MSRPHDIPDGIWEVALRLWAEMRTVDHSRSEEWALGDVDEIARAILAERERCATYVERRPGNITDRQHIARAMRMGDAYNEKGEYVPSPARANDNFVTVTHHGEIR